MSALSTTDALRSLGGPQAQAGWHALVERHGPDVWRLILSRSRDAHEAEDAYQDFWMALPRSAASFRPSGVDQERSARAWLMRVAYTTAIDRVRRRRPPLVDIRADAKGAAMESSPATARLVAQDQLRPGTEDLADRDYLVAQVQGALKDLPENYRRPLLLYVVGGLSYEELAADLRCTVNNARVRVHRGLKRLREVLGGDQRLNERALAGLILPVMFAMPQAPTLSAALGSGTAGVTVGTGAGALSGGLSGTATTTAVAVGTTAAVAAGVGLTVALAGVPSLEVPTAVVEPSPVVRLLDDFERPTLHIDGTSHNGMPPELSLTPAPAGGSGSALRFGWSPEHKTWLDCHYEQGRNQPLAGVTATADTVVTMQVWVPQTTRGVNHLAIRFQDSDGEIFEWRAPLPQSPTGWRTVTYHLDPTMSSTWDKRPLANRRVDLPMTLLGYAVEIQRHNTQAGVVIIDDVRLHDPADGHPAGR